MTAITAWYLNQLDTDGLPAVLAAQFVICLAIGGTIGAAWTAADRWNEHQHIDETTFLEADDGIRTTENYANAPARKETP